MLFIAAGHACADDIEHRENARLGAVDDAVLEILELFPAGTADVDDGGDARAQGKTVRVDAAVAVVAAARAGAGVDMHVDIDQTRGYVEPGDIDDFLGLGFGDVDGDPGDFPILDANVPGRVDFVERVDNVTALEQHVELGLCKGGSRQQQSN